MFDHPLLGTATYLFMWFSSFLYAGFIIPITDVYWPLRALHYVFPISYSVRSMIWSDFVSSRYDSCDAYGPSDYCYCGADAIDASRGCGGRVVLDEIGIIYKSISSRNTLASDALACVGRGRGRNGLCPRPFNSREVLAIKTSQTNHVRTLRPRGEIANRPNVSRNEWRMSEI